MPSNQSTGGGKTAIRKQLLSTQYQTTGLTRPHYLSMLKNTTWFFKKMQLNSQPAKREVTAASYDNIFRPLNKLMMLGIG